MAKGSVEKLAAIALTLTCCASLGATSVKPAPAVEATAQAACIAQAKGLKLKIPPGGCTTPAARLKFLGHASEAVCRNRLVAPGGAVACRNAATD